ncbi:dihydrolipoyl dehydrogenase [Bacillus thuringiensis]|uniref:Dihydrolipoyl dehydrogenase n=3 Tax=Bacillus thuringiensis TaxID=1428 RepID=A0AB35PIZ8_BACTU|nr:MULTISPECIES: dihydrolipoyl dehydrogenase [Bacillus]MED1158521.1 dihydrolipoyl dehydrogenase [Bacillus paranthracis]AFQ26298.1 dihydrolipoamide dehydrogenase [Bacillus thuringiensis HD-789]AJH05432.1 dihydrolipoyl dehydrogenase [Bacillus thuringiensis HD1002]AND24438.1 dihydrolipoamide dehydrogenase [Bacillus thuringiensis serovar israelensis]EEN00208.1 Dihydrolipoyl dehydrogenase [Bacillus thuringiensis IBL 4222]
MREIETIVIGSGPGGYVAAIRAAQLGQQVAIIERENLGGVCANVGCIPSKALISVGHRFEEAKYSEDMGIFSSVVNVDFAKVQEFKNGVVKKLVDGVEGLLNSNKVDVIKGEAYFIDANTICVSNKNAVQTYTFKNAIIATGSRPVEIPPFEFTKRVINSTGALNLAEVPSKLVVIGGGYIGTELGSAYASLGSLVTIIEGGKDILTGFDKQMTQILKENLINKGVKIVVDASAKGVEEVENGVIVTYEIGGEEKKVDADYVLITVGRRPNTENMGFEKIGIEFSNRGLLKIDQQCRTNLPNIFAIGDIVAGPQLAHKAFYEGKVAAEAIAGEFSFVDYLAIPAVCFTTPELATVGYTEEQAKAEDMEVKVVKFPFSANVHAMVSNEEKGFLRLLARKEDGILVGAQIAGNGASEIIAEMGLAIEAGMTVEDIALTPHAHPTLSESLMKAAETLICKFK